MSYNKSAIFCHDHILLKKILCISSPIKEVLLVSIVLFTLFACLYAFYFKNATPHVLIKIGSPNHGWDFLPYFCTPITTLDRRLDNLSRYYTHTPLVMHKVKTGRTGGRIRNPVYLPFLSLARFSHSLLCTRLTDRHSAAFRGVVKCAICLSWWAEVNPTLI